MTIWMITREHEYEGGNGSWFEEYVDEDLGYFTDQAAAEQKLADIVDEEKDAHRRNWMRTDHASWAMRKAEHDRITAQNRILMDHGVAAASLTPAPHVWDEPVYGGWKPEYSAYNVIAIEPGSV